MAPVSMTQDGVPGVTIGVDTHKDSHVAQAKDQLGRRVGPPKQFAATPAGYRELLEWAEKLGPVEAVGIEGTGSWGAGLARYLISRGVPVVEVQRPNRQQRRRRGKSDPADADAAASAVLSGDATATPKSGDGRVEMVRVLRVARKTALKARTQARNAMYALLVTAPEALRAALQDVSGVALVRKCARLQPGPFTTPVAAVKAALRSLAQRCLALDREIATLSTRLNQLVAQVAPQLLALYGVGTDSAGALLVAAGDNPQRLRSEAGFASLCGVSPIEASSGVTHRHRVNRGGDRQANAALYRIVVVRLRWDRATRRYAARRSAQGKSNRDIIRCLKRYVAREIYHTLQTTPSLPSASQSSS